MEQTYRAVAIYKSGDIAITPKFKSKKKLKKMIKEASLDPNFGDFWFGESEGTLKAVEAFMDSRDTTVIAMHKSIDRGVTDMTEQSDNAMKMAYSPPAKAMKPVEGPKENSNA